MKTACIKCKNIIIASNEPNPQWYSYTCCAVVNPYTFDPISGMDVPGSFKHCRDVNTNGSCVYFIEKI